MPVPEAPMNHKNRAVARENDIRLARKVISVEPKPIPKLVQSAAHGQFGSSIPRAYARHHGTSLFGCDSVHVEARYSQYCPRWLRGQGRDSQRILQDRTFDRTGVGSRPHMPCATALTDHPKLAALLEP
jgi:hypothetical protein